MSEYKQLSLVLLGAIVLSIIGFSLFNAIPAKSSPSADYKAVLYPNGKLVEVFIYHIEEDKKYTMLYRYWDAPLSQQTLDNPHIQLLSVTCPPGSVAYVKDYQNRVTVLSGSNTYDSIIAKKAYPNEVGCYFPGKIPAGDYKVVYEYKIKPPIQCDNEYCHINLMLANNHIFYSSVNITIIDPGNDIKAYYVHVPLYNIERRGNTITVTGESPADQILEVELVYRLNGSFNPSGFPSYTSDVFDTTKELNEKYLLTYNGLRTTSYVLLGLMLIYPLVLLGIYYWKGREKKFVVPEYLSYVPNPKLKPWLVNLLYKGDALTIDDDALYATILDLEKRGYIEIVGDENHVVIKLKKEPQPGELDRYEKDVFDFLKRYSRNGVFDIVSLEENIKLLPLNERIKLSEIVRQITYTPKWMNELGKKYVTSFKYKFIIIGIVILTVTILSLPFLASGANGIYAPYSLKLAIPIGIIGFQNLIAGAAPSQLFGRWRGDHYKEKLEWDAFKKLLSDFAMIQKYAPQDLVIWKEWLIYGTALGVGKKVAEAMKKLNVTLPTSVYFIYVWPRHYRTVVDSVAPKGKAGKGGFGAGGGFGGGGGGVR